MERWKKSELSRRGHGEDGEIQMNFVNALNAIHGQFWLVVLVLVAMLLLHIRYRNVTPSGSLVEELNSLHVAWIGFVLCLCAIAVILGGHEAAGDKIFLSGASFIGGIAVSKAIGNGNGNGNGTGGAH